MNKKNYCTLPVSKKLVEAGIVIETDAVWVRFKSGWQLIKRDSEYIYTDRVPAPTFAEVWKELPEDTWIRKCDGKTKIMNEDNSFVTDSTNPTDTAALLYIWIKENER